MSSKRILKKQVQDAISNVVEEAYSYQLYHPGKKDKEVDQLIDRSVEVLDDTLQKINSIGKLKDKTAIRKQFSKLKTDFSASFDKLSSEVSKLG